MTDPTAAAPPEPPPLRSHRRRKLLMTLAALCFLAIGAVTGSYWWTTVRFEVATDDAYVAGNIMKVSPLIAGTVTAVHADDTDYVTAGQVLVTIDDADTRIALDQAKANLAQAVRDVRVLFSRDGALAATVALQETNLSRLTEDVARRQRLADTGAVSAEELKHARDAVQQATAQLASARKDLEANRVLIDHATLVSHPRVTAAAARLREAYLAWRRTVVPAPVAGYVARRSVQAGQRITPETPLMAVVPLGEVWVDANFKEGQLRHMRIGQPATMTADLYGSDVVFHGRVVGLAAGTGGAFALLPPQNATGNWIKVVQRIPVRIALDSAELARHPLRIGLSMEVTVTVQDDSGPQLAAGRQQDLVGRTRVFDDLDQGAEALIDGLIRDNLGTDLPALSTAGRTVR